MICLTGCYRLSFERIYTPKFENVKSGISNKIKFEITDVFKKEDNDFVVVIKIKNETDSVFLLDRWMIALRGDSVIEKNQSYNPIRPIVQAERDLIHLPGESIRSHIMTVSNWTELIGNDGCFYLVYMGVIYNDEGRSVMANPSYNMYNAKYCE